MTKPNEPEEIVISDLFPMLSEEQLEAKRDFLFSYFEIALHIFERLENEERSDH